MDPYAMGVGAALLSAVSWAAGSVLFKRIGETVTPLGLTLTKGAVSLVLLGLVLAKLGLDPIAVKPLLLLLASGVLGIAMADTLFFAALQDLGPYVLIVFLMLGYIGTALLAVPLLNEMPAPMAWMGIAMVLLGVASVLWPKLANDDEKRATSIRGGLLGLASMLCMALSTIVAKKALNLTEASTIWATFIRMAAGTAGVFALGLATGRVGEWLNPVQNLRMMGLVLVSVCVVTFGGFWLSLVAIKYVDVAIATSLGATEPLFILPLAVLFLKERITVWQVAGTLAAIGGVVLIYRSAPGLS